MVWASARANVWHADHAPRKSNPLSILQIKPSKSVETIRGHTTPKGWLLALREVEV
jgi:hypothetical protein